MVHKQGIDSSATHGSYHRHRLRGALRRLRQRLDFGQMKCFCFLNDEFLLRSEAIQLQPAPQITLRLGGATGSRIDLPLAP